jgi:hypothetical protein
MINRRKNDYVFVYDENSVLNNTFDAKGLEPIGEVGSPLSHIGSPKSSSNILKPPCSDDRWLQEAKNITINIEKKQKTITKIRPGTFSSQGELDYSPTLFNMNTFDLRPPLKMKNKKSKKTLQNLDNLSLNSNSLSRDSFLDSLLTPKAVLTPKVLNKIPNKNLRGIVKDPIASNLSTLKSAFIANSLAHSLKPESQDQTDQTGRCMYMFMYIYAFTYICIHILYIHMCIYVCIYTYIYIYTYIRFIMCI